MSTTKTEAKIFACTQSTEIGEDISKAFGVGLGKVSFYNFSDGEYQPSFEETIRGDIKCVISHFENRTPKGEFVIVLDNRR